MKFFSYYGTQCPNGVGTYAIDIPQETRQRAYKEHRLQFEQKIPAGWLFQIIEFEDFEIITEYISCRGTIFGNRLQIENIYADKVRRGHGTQFIKDLSNAGFLIWTWSEEADAVPFWDKMRDLGYIQAGNFWDIKN